MSMKQHWVELEKGCLATYAGGHHEPKEYAAFKHGMSTVFSVLQGDSRYIFRSDLEKVADMLKMSEMTRDFVIEFISRTLKERARNDIEGIDNSTQQPQAKI